MKLEMDMVPLFLLQQEQKSVQVWYSIYDRDKSERINYYGRSLNWVLSSRQVQTRTFYHSLFLVKAGIQLNNKRNSLFQRY